ncbi:MAG: competence/damage-inducible protein A [Bacteroidota bacterium]
MDIHIITVGDEILIGQTIDTNSAWMGETLNRFGARIQEITTVADDLEDITNSLERAFERCDIVLMTGGLGPTKDDVTKKAITEFYGTGFTFSQPTYDLIVERFKKWGRSTTEAHRQQCYMPENAELLHNKVGTAPGMWMEKEGKVLVSMPGVPYEMKYLMEAEVIPRLVQQFQAEPIAHRTIRTVGEGESRIAVRIEAFEENLPDHIKLAYLPGSLQVRLRLTGRGKTQEVLERELEELEQQLLPNIEDLVYGFGKTSLEEAIGQILKAQGKKMATAESCTGGYLAHKITSISGSSAYYWGSVIAYDNQIKQDLLDVPAETLETEGAVSEATVRAMVKGLLQRFPVDVGVAISGIAGPGGGTPEKPVGTIWLAVGDGERIHAQKIKLGKDRLRNIQYASVHALNMVRQFLTGQLRLEVKSEK